MRFSIPVIALALVLAAPANSQSNDEGGALLAKQAAPSRQNARLTVRSSSFIGGGLIPERHAKNGDNVSPPLTWTKGPQGTRSYAVIAEDIGSNRDEPILHWMLYDLDGSVTQISSDMAKTASPGNGASQAKNSGGSVGYSGPATGQDGSGIYHFQVFALNTKLNIDPASADRDAVLAAMKGKVLASGDLIGRYATK
jgi:Raf kinase inhibitor-like YbhB/YbcL family protein